jgi:hypothetical protein
MTLSRTAVLTVGALTVLPLIYLAGFIVLMFGMVFFEAVSSRPQATGFPLGFALLFLVHLAFMLLVFALMVFYVVHLFRTTEVGADKKALWAVVLFLGNMFAMPVYWYLYLWRPIQKGAEGALTDSTHVTG